MSSGKAIQTLRILKGKSQEQLGVLLGIGQQAVSKFENLESVDKKRVEKIVVALKSSRNEVEIIQKLLLPPRKN